MSRKDCPDNAGGYHVGGRPGREHPDGWSSARPADTEKQGGRDTVRPADRRVRGDWDRK